MRCVNQNHIDADDGRASHVDDETIPSRAVTTRRSIARAFLRRPSIRTTTTTTTTTTTRRMTTMGVRGDDDAPLRVKKMSEHATIPSRGSDGAAGYDLSRYANDAMRSRTVGGRSVVDRWSIVIDLCSLGPVWRLNF